MGSYTCLYICVVFCLVVCSIVFLVGCLVVCLSACLVVYLGICLVVYLAICLVSVCLSGHLSGCLSSCLSNHLSDCLFGCCAPTVLYVPCTHSHTYIFLFWQTKGESHKTIPIQVHNRRSLIGYSTGAMGVFTSIMLCLCEFDVRTYIRIYTLGFSLSTPVGTLQIFTGEQ